jgi:branched-chain amino acid transport system substrate-binding protein
MRLSTIAFSAAFVAMLATPSGAKEPLKLGAVYGLTKAISFLGIPEERALKMRVDELNARGGINGHKIELTIYDTEGDGTKAVQQYRRLVESDQVQVIFGPSSSGESLLVLDAAQEAGVPTIMHAGTERVIIPPRKFVFNTPPSDRIAISHMLAFFKAKGIRTVAMLSSSDGFGQSGKNMLRELADSYGVKIALEHEFDRQDPDMTVPVLKARESNADAMLVWSAPPAPAVVLRNAKNLGYDKPIFTGYGAASDSLITSAGPEAAQGVYASSLRLLAPETLPASDPAKKVVDDLVDAYKKTYGEKPQPGAQHSYDAMLILEQAVSSIDDDKLSRSSIRDAIEKVNVVGTNGKFKFSPENHGGLDSDSGSFVMLRWLDGKWRMAE